MSRPKKEALNVPEPRSAEEQHHMCNACAHYDDTIDPCEPEAVPNEPCPHCTQYARSGDDATDLWAPKPDADENTQDTLCAEESAPQSDEDAEDAPDQEPNVSAEAPDNSHPLDIHFLGDETIDTEIALSKTELNDVARRMAEAISRKEALETELDSYRKDINKQIKDAEKDASEAAFDYRLGRVRRTVDCEKLADYGVCQIIWRAKDSGEIVQRRAMTAEEKQLPLPLAYPDAPQAAPSPAGDTIGTPHATNRRTCLDCAHMAARTDGGEMPEPCQSCAQVANGEADNWVPVRECRTCVHASNDVTMPPCCNCALNVDEGHRGEEDRWEWPDAEAGEAAPGDEDPAYDADDDLAEEGFFDPVTGDITPLIPAASTPETTSV